MGPRSVCVVGKSQHTSMKAAQPRMQSAIYCRCGKIGHFGAVSYQTMNSVEGYDPSPEQSDSTYDSSALVSALMSTWTLNP